MLAFDPHIIQLLLLTLAAALMIVIGLLLWDLRDKREQIRRLTALALTQGKAERLDFYDDKGELKLSVNSDMVYYLEAADNYVIIHYINAGKAEKLFVRTSLKNIEWRYRDKQLVRCHRSFIVNLPRVEMMRRQDGEVVLDFNDERIPAVPVSKGYVEQIMKRFTSTK